MSRAPATRARGSVGIGVIGALVILQVIIVVAVVASARDQDMTAQRMSTARAYYAADSVSEMALREVYSYADEDGDGGVGSLASGVVANGPTVNGAHAAAAISSSGGVTTLSVSGTSLLANRAMSVRMTQIAGPVKPLASYSTSASPAVPVAREYASAGWGSAVGTSALGGTVAWEVLRTCPVGTDNPQRALLVLTQDHALSLSVYSGGLWGAASTLTSDVGTYFSRVYAGEYEHRSGNLMAIYRKGASTSVYYRTYTSSSPAEQSFTLGLGAAPRWMELVSKPGSNELVALVATTTGLYAAVWNGSAWGNTQTLETVLPSVGRPFHAAYMRSNGTAMVVWTATTGAPKYATWNGTAWSAAAVLPAISGGVPAGWVKLVGSPLRTSNEILVAIIGTNKQMNLNSWTGAAWGTNLVAETQTAASSAPRVDLSYQSDGARALAVWHRSGQNALLYRTWSAGAWSAQQTGPDMASESKSIKLAYGYGRNEIMMLDRRGSGDYTDFNVYSSGGTVTVGTTVITGPSGANTGVTLPATPSATAGVVDLTLGSGTIAPGAYGILTTDGTVGFTAGTYVFSTVNMSGTLNFDSSAGPITVNITSGGLTGVNSCTLANTGENLVQINIIGGDLLFKNSATAINITILVYNGTATFKNSIDGSLDLYASGNIDFKNNGVVSFNGVGTSSLGYISAVLWTAGAPGARTDLSTSTAPAAAVDPCALAGSPMPGSPAVNLWVGVAPQ